MYSLEAFESLNVKATRDAQLRGAVPFIPNGPFDINKDKTPFVGWRCP